MSDYRSCVPQEHLDHPEFARALAVVMERSGGYCQIAEDCDGSAPGRLHHIHSIRPVPEMFQDKMFLVCDACHFAQHGAEPWQMARSGTDPLNIISQCTSCERSSWGRLHFDASMQLVDSDGGVVFADGWTCETCLGDPQGSSDAGKDS